MAAGLLAYRVSAVLGLCRASEAVGLSYYSPFAIASEATAAGIGLIATRCV